MEAEHANAPQLLVTERSFRLALYKLLKYCKTPRSAEEIHCQAAGYSELKVGIYTPGMLVDWAEKAGLVVALSEENDEANNNPSQAESTEQSPGFVWQTTSVGLNFMEAEEPFQRLDKLITSSLGLERLYRGLLDYCLVPRKLMEIEEWMKGDSENVCVLERHNVHPAFLIDQMERAGGLEFDGGWRTTEQGRGVAAGLNA
ncbi:MAG: hypothetical protein AB2L09_12130 [Coriobacteriia bacterium]